jgi:uncharacterized delta-60 repeat protein
MVLFNIGRLIIMKKTGRFRRWWKFWFLTLLVIGFYSPAGHLVETAGDPAGPRALPASASLFARVPRQIPPESIPVSAADTLAVGPHPAAIQIVVTTIGPGDDSAATAALQPDGKLVVAGSTFNGRDNDFALVRYNTDGSLDTGFGANVKEVTPIGMGNDFIRGAAIQADDRIVACGTSYGKAGTALVLARYERDGSLDRSFGADGMVVITTGSRNDSLNAFALQPDGTMVAAGYAGGGANGDFLVLRRLPDGRPDPSFGTDGSVTVDFGGSADSAFALVLQPDGKIVAAGETTPLDRSTRESDFALARLLSDGRLDPSFGTAGRMKAALSTGDDRITALALAKDGGIIAAGYAGLGSGFALARFRIDGSLDPGFGRQGLAIIAPSLPTGMFRAVALLPDGRMLAAGYGLRTGRNEIALARFHPDGGPDTTFGEGGFLFAAGGGGEWQGCALALPADGSIIVAGSSDNGHGRDFMVLRYKIPRGR